MELRTSERKKAKIKLGLQGPAGSGKTTSALSMILNFADRGDKPVTTVLQNISIWLLMVIRMEKRMFSEQQMQNC